MKRTLRLDMTAGHDAADSIELTIVLRVPVAPPDPEGHSTRISLDHQLEEIRRRMRSGTAAKIDEDNLVIFRLLQAFGIEYWPVESHDL
ncbi:MAG: hypothetical protein DIU84_04610 [Bacillota bacterium]|nr:MAG: hypothetical protein DIU84_04610 [Bacillota bacterium]